MHTIPNTATIAHPDQSAPIKRLKCCCCGGIFNGRQFNNQDIGHGLGDCCVEYVSTRVEDVPRTYGLPGVHYGLKAAETA